jgi:hypothetical protein
MELGEQSTAAGSAHERDVLPIRANDRVEPSDGKDPWGCKGRDGSAHTRDTDELGNVSRRPQADTWRVRHRTCEEDVDTVGVDGEARLIGHGPSSERALLPAGLCIQHDNTAVSPERRHFGGRRSALTNWCGLHRVPTRTGDDDRRHEQ